MLVSFLSLGVDRILLNNKTPILATRIVNNLFIVCCFLLILSTQQIHSMRVYPMFLKQNISIPEQQQQQLRNVMEQNSLKKLRKLPHVFNNVLELPFRWDADVAVEEHDEYFRFVTDIDLEGAGDGHVRAHAVEIHPGVTKIVVRKGNGDYGEMELLLEQLKVDTWRYRLPASTMPELATAVVEDGELIVTVPKGGDGGFGGGRDVWGSGGRLVLVQ